MLYFQQGDNLPEKKQTNKFLTLAPNKSSQESHQLVLNVSTASKCWLDMVFLYLLWTVTFHIGSST